MDTRSHNPALRRAGLRGPARLGVAALAASTVAAALLATGPAFAATASHRTAAAAYTFTTLDDQADRPDRLSGRRASGGRSVHIGKGSAEPRGRGVSR